MESFWYLELVVQGKRREKITGKKGGFQSILWPRERENLLIFEEGKRYSRVWFMYLLRSFPFTKFRWLQTAIDLGIIFFYIMFLEFHLRVNLNIFHFDTEDGTLICLFLWLCSVLEYFSVASIEYMISLWFCQDPSLLEPGRPLHPCRIINL